MSPAVLSDRGKPAEAADRAALRLALRKLDAQRAVVYAALEPAIRIALPRLRAADPVWLAR